MHHMKRRSVALCLPIALNLIGCSAEMAEDEDIGEVSLAFNQSQCSTATASATITATGSASWTSQGNYGLACIAVDDLAPRGDQFLGYRSDGIGPTSQAQCEATTIRTVFYTRPATGGAWVVAKDESRAGLWRFNACELITALPTQGVAKQVRAATTVRRPSGGSIVTYPFHWTIKRKPS